MNNVKNKKRFRHHYLTICFFILTLFLAFGISNNFFFGVKKNPLKVADPSPRENLMDTTLANGFDFPFGDGNGGGTYIGYKDKKKYKGWYIATKTAEKYELGIHTGEDWNGNGKGNTDFGQPVFATATGKVLEAKDFGAPWGNVVYIEHKFAENGKIKTVYSLYAHLNELKTKKGKLVKKREQVGTIGTGHDSYPAHLHFEVRKESMKDFEVTYWPSSHEKTVEWVKENYFDASDFVKSHRKISLPSKKEKVLVVVKHEYKMYVYTKGKLTKTYDVSLSQSPVGHKEVQGDNKLPEGEYRVTEKSRGPFGGDYAAYFGPAWMRLSYPNNFDAATGLKKKIITKKQHDAIVAANNKGLQPSKSTGLGGGVGIHGWAGEWP
ncbi:MAG: peptidoglycan DD-metalloendopeptidase family protein, partial [Bacteroidia bacterium]|nr:peptidoglycan DD-metalloendopeptidase family protein [Bacteroidia bacterium]